MQFAEVAPHHFDIAPLWSAQAAFSDRAFPGVTPLAVLRHLGKEVEETAAEPDRIEEWADLLLLTLDGARRQGFTLGDLLRAAFLKIDVNEGRSWPVHQDKDRPVEHVREVEPTEALLRSLAGEARELLQEPAESRDVQALGMIFEVFGADVEALDLSATDPDGMPPDVLLSFGVVAIVMCAAAAVLRESGDDDVTEAAAGGLDEYGRRGLRVLERVRGHAGAPV